MMYAVMFYKPDIVVIPESVYVVEGNGYYDAMKRLEQVLGYKPWKSRRSLIEKVDDFVFIGLDSEAS